MPQPLPWKCTCIWSYNISYEINSKLGAIFYNSISAKLKLNKQLNHQIYIFTKSHLSRTMIMPSMRETMNMYNSDSFTCTLMLGMKHLFLASFEEVQFRHCIPNPIWLSAGVRYHLVHNQRWTSSLQNKRRLPKKSHTTAEVVGTFSLKSCWVTWRRPLLKRWGHVLGFPNVSLGVFGIFHLGALSSLSEAVLLVPKTKI